MVESEHQLIRWIAERLRYRTLPELFGREVEIESLRTVETDICSVVNDLLPEIGRLIDPDEYVMKRILAEYRMLDLTLEGHHIWLDEADLGGTELLGSLGFIMDAMESHEFEVVASLIGDKLDDPALLGELEADLQEEKAVVRILLRLTDDLEEEASFPRRFSIVDACLTNAASVWLHKHSVL